jgi:hypothetical protein
MRAQDQRFRVRSKRVRDMRFVRKRFRVLLLAAIVAGFVVPVGFALSPEYETVTRSERTGLGIAASATAVGIPVLLRSSDRPFASFLRPVPDAAQLLMVGAALIGLAAAVRKAR